MKPFAGGRIRDANLAIKYLLQFDGVVPDPGIEKTEEIEQIVDIVNSRSWGLTAQQLGEMDVIREQVGTRFCRQCQYCLPCSQEVWIPGVLVLKILYDLWPPEWYHSWGYVKRSVESAENCIQCGECEDKCPYELPIREMIDENMAFHNSLTHEYQRRKMK
ncbi:MAG: 4Fe-4S dicluster domain-containing protein [Candidatus Thorarchaeota archaeon]